MILQRLPYYRADYDRLAFRSIASCSAVICLAAVLQVSARAQLISYNWVPGQNSIAPDYYGVSGITSTSVTRGSGLTAPPYTGDIFTSAGYAAGSSLATAIADNDYIGITITNTTPSTQTVDITGLDLGYESTNGGPTLLWVGSSTYGFTTDGLFDELSSKSSPETVFIGANFGTLTAASPSVEIRLYGVDPSSSSGLFALTGEEFGALGVYGSVKPAAATAPEPSPAILLVAGTPFAYFIRRKIFSRR